MQVSKKNYPFQGIYDIRVSIWNYLKADSYSVNEISYTRLAHVAQALRDGQLIHRQFYQKFTAYAMVRAAYAAASFAR